MGCEVGLGRADRPSIQVLTCAGDESGQGEQTCDPDYSHVFFELLLTWKSMGRAPVGQQALDSTGSQGSAWAWAGFHCSREGPGMFPTHWEPIAQSKYHGSAGEWLGAYKTF